MLWFLFQDVTQFWLFSYLCSFWFRPVQASSQTDLENWVTAVHSASAALLARREGNQDTLQLLRRRSRCLLQRIDTDGKMKKMAELQLSIIKEQKNRRAVENQVRG